MTLRSVLLPRAALIDLLRAIAVLRDSVAS